MARNLKPSFPHLNPLTRIKSLIAILNDTNNIRQYGIEILNFYVQKYHPVPGVPKALSIMRCRHEKAYLSITIKPMGCWSYDISQTLFA